MKNKTNKSFFSAYITAVAVLAVVLLTAMSAFGFYLRAEDEAFLRYLPEREGETVDSETEKLSLDAELLSRHLNEPLCEFEDVSDYERYLSSVGETELVSLGENNYAITASDGMMIVEFTMRPGEKKEPLPENAESLTAYAERGYTVTAAVLPESLLWVNGITVSDKYKVKNDGVYSVYAIEGFTVEPAVKVTTDGRECIVTADEHGQYIEDYALIEKHPSDTVKIGGTAVEGYIVNNGIGDGVETVRVTGYAEISDISVESGEHGAENGKPEVKPTENDESLASEYSELARNTAETIAKYISNDISTDEVLRNIDPDSELCRTLRLLEVNWFTPHTDTVLKDASAEEFCRLSETEFSCRCRATQTVALTGGSTVDIPIDFTLCFRDTESGPLVYDFIIN